MRTPRGCSPVPAGAADSPRHPETARAPPPGPLTDSADTQATKPKVSRIQARRIFPEDRLGAAAGHPSATKPLGQHRAQPANRDPSTAAAATAARARGVRLRLGSSGCGSGRSPPAPASAPPSSAAPGAAPPSHLLVSALPASELGSGRLLSGALLALRDCTPPRAPSPRRGSAPFREESVRRGLERSCS